MPIYIQLGNVDTMSIRFLDLSERNTSEMGGFAFMTVHWRNFIVGNIPKMIDGYIPRFLL